MSVLPLALALLAAGYIRAAAQQASPVNNPFAGEWSVELSIATAPGKLFELE
jgi:hypothetical protein